MKTTGITGRKLEKLDTLTSLRFVAAAMILVGHGYGYFHIPAFPTYFPLNQGVSFFFVLSGFVLAYAYPELPSFKSILYFLWARFARIWPAHIASLLLMLCIVPAALWYVSPNHPFLYSIANGLMVHAWLPFRESYLGLNGVSWSISTEFFFYLCFPVLIYKWHTTWPVKMLAVTMLLVGMVVLSNSLQLSASSSYQGVGAHALIYIHPVSRLFEFALGIMACGLFKVLKPHSNHLSFAGATLIEFFVVVLLIVLLGLITLLASNNQLLQLIGDAGMVWFKNSGGSLLFFIMIIIFAFQRGMISALLKHRYLVLLGEISFSLYLVHTIVLKYFDSHELFNLEWSYLLYWLASITISYLIYRVVEMPCRSFLLHLVRRDRALPLRLTVTFQNILSLRNKSTFWLCCVLLSVILTMSQWHQSTISVVDNKQVHTLFDERNMLLKPASFENGLDLVAVSLERHDNQVELAMAWCAKRELKLNQFVAIHLLDQQHEIKTKSDVLFDKGEGSLDKGACFQSTRFFSNESFDGVTMFGVALYVDVKNLIHVEGAQMDWGNQRLLVPLQLEQ